MVAVVLTLKLFAKEGLRMQGAVLQNVIQLGIVVDDALKAAKITCALFDIDPEMIDIMDFSEEAVRVNYSGKEIASHLKIATVKKEKLEFEFIQFVGGDANSHKDFYDRNGPGLQHICVSVSNYKAAIQCLEELGANSLIKGGDDETGYYRYMDLRELNGLIIELYDEKLSAQRALE